MKKSIKKFLIITQVLGWSTLLASACTDNDLKTSSTTTNSNSSETNKNKPKVNSSTNAEQNPNTNVNKEESVVSQESDNADAMHTESGKQKNSQKNVDVSPPHASMSGAEGDKKDQIHEPSTGVKKEANPDPKVKDENEAAGEMSKVSKEEKVEPSDSSEDHSTSSSSTVGGSPSSSQTKTTVDHQDSTAAGQSSKQP